jgi:hypothetical protein
MVDASAANRKLFAELVSAHGLLVITFGTVRCSYEELSD